MDTERLELIEQAADHFSMQPSRARIREEGGQPAKSAHDIALEQVIAERLTPDELEMAHDIARGDMRAPYPPRRYPDESPTALRYEAWNLIQEVASLTERRMKRDSDATH